MKWNILFSMFLYSYQKFVTHFSIGTKTCLFTISQLFKTALKQNWSFEMQAVVAADICFPYVYWKLQFMVLLDKFQISIGRFLDGSNFHWHVSARRRNYFSTHNRSDHLKDWQQNKLKRLENFSKGVNVPWNKSSS